jgi:hypothetical protein
MHPSATSNAVPYSSMHFPAKTVSGVCKNGCGHNSHMENNENPLGNLQDVLFSSEHRAGNPTDPSFF